MPVLLLAQGDATAKDLLRKAIEARYGVRPPALDSLRIDFKGRTKVKVGPVQTWVPLDSSAYFQFPTSMRWDFVAKPLKLPVQHGVEAFDGFSYRSVRGSKTPTIVEDVQQVSSARQRLWAIASLLLTPLSDLFVRLEATGDRSLRAVNTKLNDSAEIFLRPNHTIDMIRTYCLNPDTGEMQNHVIHPSEEQKALNELYLPAKIMMGWDENEVFEVEPVNVEVNPSIPDAVFRVEDEN